MRVDAGSDPRGFQPRRAESGQQRDDERNDLRNHFFARRWRNLHRSIAQRNVRQRWYIGLGNAGPQGNRTDITVRGRLALERIDVLVGRMVPLLPPEWQRLLQGQIHQVQRAAAVLEAGLDNLNQEDETVSEDTQVWYWSAADEQGEVTSNE